MRFVVVTGMSGGGKSTALKMLEDVGFYCVDNLPVSLVEKFAELVSMPGSEVGKVALGLDVRSDQSFEDATKILEKLKSLGTKLEILFMDADEGVLIKRYKETRRVHPLAMDKRVEDGVRIERRVLENIRRHADYVIDTSNLLTRELKEELNRIFVEDAAYNSLMVTVMSFGFKHGIPADADLVLDVRFLPNPFYIEELKCKTGNDREVQEYVMGFREAEVFLEKLTDMLEFLIPNYVKEGKNRLVVAIGCTGGQHRSVTLARELYRRMKGRGGYGCKLYHRDITQQGK
ncbi:RNase adapter RapZ [uncultured Acetatifactor sp.]|uniref:RNase adapter RapZ n=1 Tax=uncultured Acetatifactor sp. TaxID=1671927 RepID=UPI0025E1DD4E|nr:RNase adapter RapZ [uncultured Acetatifactor sp.]MCI8696241.1 RNase adapter RapZ [Lachnospiraceae bacterium]MCI9232759.1 RNase adapter RapZ [Lachnospiraceae bacterium]MCI9572100.1 RNase adapter RapZ [Lachnospiraceae bacterium]